MLNQNSTIREIVAADYRAAAVFGRHGLDFCCGGNRPVAEACREAGIDAAKVVSEIEAATAEVTDEPRVMSWPLDLLADFIVSNHHAYVRSAIETIGAHARKVASVHGENHPETVEIASRFDEIAAEMTSHMAKEEQILFPYIRRLTAAERSGGPAPRAPFGSIANPIRMMESEHQAAGDTMAAIRRLSGGYTPPDDACTTYKVTYKELEAFEADLHRHVHLENNVLFPRALQAEKSAM
jgi:regulator of cell morphogenesis and NO signaling